MMQEFFFIQWVIPQVYIKAVENSVEKVKNSAISLKALQKKQWIVGLWKEEKLSLIHISGVLLQTHQAAGLIDSYQRPRAYADEEDPSVCIVEVSFVISRGMNQIRVAAHIQV